MKQERQQKNMQIFTIKGTERMLVCDVRCPRSPSVISANTKSESVTQFGAKVMRLMYPSATELLGIQENITHEENGAKLMNVHFFIVFYH